MKLAASSIVLLVFIGMNSICFGSEGQQSEKEWMHHSPEKALAAGRYQRNQGLKQKRRFGGSTAVAKKASKEARETKAPSLTGDSQ
jgi:hypothetical protein